MELYFDESGNTGTDLLNEEQPIAVLASTSIKADVCAQLLLPLISQRQRELKYSRVKNSVAGRAVLVDLVRSGQLDPSNTKIMAAHKRFYLVAHLVDKLIEPSLYERNIDLYAGDGHVSTAEMFYAAGPFIFPNGDWLRMLKAFEAAIRRRSLDAYKAYDEAVEQACRKVVGTEYGIEAAGLYTTVGRLPELLRGFDDLAVFDPMPDLFIGLVNFWMADTKEPLSVTHDRSKPMKRNEEFIRVMMTPLPIRTIGYGGRKAVLPLRIADLQFSNSENHPQLQLSDLVAGAVVDLLLAKAKHHQFTDYHKDLEGAGLLGLIAGGIGPTGKIERRNEAGDDEVSLVDGSADFYRDAMRHRDDVGGR
jgi:hypothetical protein